MLSQQRVTQQTMAACSVTKKRIDGLLQEAGRPSSSMYVVGTTRPFGPQQRGTNRAYGRPRP